MSADHARRFSGVARLYGGGGLERLQNAHVCVIGIGGVGSWAAEALARTSVGKLTLIDRDRVAESNTNRQIHALEEIYGKAKVDAMAERIHAINPECEVRRIEDFITPDNTPRLLGANFDVVVDAIDQVRAKIALIAHCKRHAIPVITCGAAGGQTNPTLVTTDDLSQTIQDPLLAKVRSSLRREHAFPRAGAKKFGVTAVYSTEPLAYPAKDASCDAATSLQGLNCAGFGSSVCVTAVFGMVAASAAISAILKR